MPLILVALTCAAFLTNIAPVNQTTPVTSAIGSEFKTSAVLYQARRPLDLIYVSTETTHGEEMNDQSKHLELDRGDYVVLENTKVDGQGRRLLRIAFDPIDEDAPSTYWIDSATVAAEDLVATIATPERFAEINEAMNPKRRRR